VRTTTIPAPNTTAHKAAVTSPRTARPQLVGTRHRVVAPALRVGEAPAAAVFAVVRRRGPVARDTIAGATGLSIATVNRQVAALLDAGLLRERADLAVSGAIGRPRIPVEINHEPFLTLGVHIGARTTSIVATDLFGRTLDAVEMPTPGGAQATALAALADSARRYLSRWHKRRALWVGVAVGGVVDGATGRVDHPRLGWTQAPVGPVLADVLGLPTSVAAHVDAMAGAELLLGTRRSVGSSLYVYARETVGYALQIEGRVHSPSSGPGTIANLPVHSELLGGTGLLESTVSDEAVLAAARRIGLDPGLRSVSQLLALARAGNDDAERLLTDRARVLGEAVALLRDLLNPDDLVVGGQAFTEYPEGMAVVSSAFSSRSVLSPREIRISAFGNRVQEAGAGIVSLGVLYTDPLGALRKATNARASVAS
jgi:predicted NBD/HSP70 family sugar kinase